MKVKELQSIPSTFRLGLTLVIVFMVISSPTVILVNPALAKTSAPPLPTISTTPSAPSTIGQAGNDGEFTTQAALSLTRASQTNNFVASKAYYDISFRTTTAGVIKSVVMDFPTGTSVGSANFIEATGIGTGTIAASAGEVLTYTVTNAVNVPANTIIRIEIGNINNPTTPSSSLTVDITTRDAANTPIDGPTPTFAYNMVQIGNAQIADGAVTTTKIANGDVTNTKIAVNAVTGPKIADGTVTSGDIADGTVTSGDIAPSFIRSKELSDGQNGWIPNGVLQQFTISDATINDNSHIFVGNGDFDVGNVVVCGEEGIFPGSFDLVCSEPPADDVELRYTVIDQPNT